MVLFDIDFFKNFNDGYGHLAGDDCLRRVGETLKPILRRPSDLAARYGGDEFAVVLGNTRIEAACDLADKIRVAIQALNISHEHVAEGDSITISAGVATLRPDAVPSRSPLDLIQAADQALYDAKEHGRNCVRAQDDAADPLPEPAMQRAAG